MGAPHRDGGEQRLVGDDVAAQLHERLVENGTQLDVAVPRRVHRDGALSSSAGRGGRACFTLSSKVPTRMLNLLAIAVRCWS